MDDSEMVECPVDGCDYGPKPVSSVAAHYSGKKAKTGHEGGIEKARMILREQSESGGGEAKPAEQADDEPKLDTQSENPVLDGPEPDARDGGQADDDDVDDECPKCGGELIDTRSTNLLTGEDGRQYDVPDDFYCSECGQGWIQE